MKQSSECNKIEIREINDEKVFFYLRKFEALETLKKGKIIDLV
jgi:hypothetical protein